MGDNKTFNSARDYPRQTLGYHYAMCLAFFGDESKSLSFLQNKANESPNGFDDKVIQDESQVVYLLSVIHFNGVNGEGKDLIRNVLEDFTDENQD